MYVHLKQSGELLTDIPGVPWTRPALERAAECIGEVHRAAGSLGLRGFMVVPGAGNIIRGNGLRNMFAGSGGVISYADAVGRKATEMNAVMLAGALKDADVPHAIIGAPGMGFSDPRVGVVEPYTSELVQEAYENENVVLIAGGSGKDKQTTDAAVMDYTLWHGAAYNDAPSVALKATKYNGIYEQDPAVYPQARQYETVSAQYMIDHELGGVDSQCLNLIAEAEGDVGLYVYSADCTPLSVLRRETIECVGTTITSRLVDPTFA